MNCEERDTNVRVPHVEQCQSSGEVTGGFVSLCRTHTLPSLRFPFQRESATSMVEGRRCSRSSGCSGLLTCIVWIMLFSFELHSPKMPRSGRISSWEVGTWAGQSPALLCHSTPSLSPLSRAHTNTCWFRCKKSGLVLSVKGSHIYQPTLVQTSECSMLLGAGAGIPQQFSWSSM